MSIKVKIGSAIEEGQTDAEVAHKPWHKGAPGCSKDFGWKSYNRDHRDIDIVIMPAKNKILALAKKLKSGVVYGAQNRIFEFLAGKGNCRARQYSGR
jgi:hypothetical protein